MLLFLLRQCLLRQCLSMNAQLPVPHLPRPRLLQEAAAAGLMGKPLTAKNVEELLAQLGLPAEFSTHSQVRQRWRMLRGSARADGDCSNAWLKTSQQHVKL